MFPAQKSESHVDLRGHETKASGFQSWNKQIEPTHEEVKDGHVHDVQQPGAAVIRWRLFHLLAVVWVHLPSGAETFTFNKY